MRELTLKNGTIYLDGEEVTNVKSFKIASSEDDCGMAELTICMDVSIDPALHE